MQKSLSLSFSNLQFFPSTLLSHQPPLLQRRSDFWQVCRRNSLLLNPFIFIHTNTGLEPLAAPQIQRQSGLLTDSLLLFIQTLTKFTSTPLIDSNHQHSTRGSYQGAWQWIWRMNIVEDDFITLQLTFTIIILVSQSTAQSRANLPWNCVIMRKSYFLSHSFRLKHIILIVCIVYFMSCDKMKVLSGTSIIIQVFELFSFCFHTA